MLEAGVYNRPGTQVRGEGGVVGDSHPFLSVGTVHASVSSLCVFSLVLSVTCDLSLSPSVGSRSCLTAS